MRCKSLLTLLLLLFCRLAFGQVDITLLKKLIIFNKTFCQEKSYLQFDKPYYVAGDTIYFKAYVTMGEKHVPSQISGILHVDLINTKGKLDQSIKLQIANGTSWGDFALPDSLPEGNYQVRAWTQWMRNDPGSFFEKTIPIGSLQDGRVLESNVAKTIIGKPDIQFFPEGGSLVTGVRSLIAFNAIGRNGLGLAVKGTVVDNDDKEICSFASIHLGMGSFELTPEWGKTYRTKLAFADGTTQTISLPQAEKEGIALSVDNDSIPVAKVTITASKTYFDENKGKNHVLLIYSGGTATTVDCTLDRALITLDILKRKLFTGVTTITLFSPNNEPLCERLIFVQNYDLLALNVYSDKNKYAPREKVNLKLNARTRTDSAATAHFSVAVTDESKVPTEENGETTILTDLLLTSDLKGYIEQPNSYFNHINDSTTKNLDMVMLTHGYRRFEWKEILSNSQQVVAYQPEHDLSIRGTVKTMMGKPVIRGTVSLIPDKDGNVLIGTTDEKGNFTFSDLSFFDTTKFILQAVTDKGRNSIQLAYNKHTDEPAIHIQNGLANDTTGNMASYLQNHKEQWDQYAKYGLPSGKMLKEVKIKASKKPQYYSQSLVPIESADQVIRGTQLIYGESLSINLMQVAHNVKWKSASHGPNFSPTMTVYINGVKGDIDQVRADDVEVIEIIKPPGSYIYGSDGLSGVIDITTKPGGRHIEDVISEGVLPIAVPGFYKARQFYAPKYEHPNDYASRKDLRSTIYWQPELATDKNGNAEISFYNADGKGTYRVVVEGMDEKGNLGRKVYRYKVE